VSEVSVEKVRPQGEPKQGCHWRDYKAVRLQGIYYGLFFDDNQCLIDYVNFNPDQSIGLFRDGHAGAGRMVATPQTRWEILDWYHLKENLSKVGLKATQTG